MGTMGGTMSRKKWTPFVKVDPELCGHVFADEGWENNKYLVWVYYPDNPKGSGNGVMTQLSIKDHQRSVRAHDWRDMQQIKNEICGLERTAVEVFPPMSRILDTSNQFHLWVYPEGHNLEFGYTYKNICVDQAHHEKMLRENLGKDVPVGRQRAMRDEFVKQCME